MNVIHAMLLAHHSSPECMSTCSAQAVLGRIAVPDALVIVRGLGSKHKTNS